MSLVCRTVAVGEPVGWMTSKFNVPQEVVINVSKRIVIDADELNFLVAIITANPLFISISFYISLMSDKKSQNIIEGVLEHIINMPNDCCMAGL